MTTEPSAASAGQDVQRGVADAVAQAPPGGERAGVSSAAGASMRGGALQPDERRPRRRSPPRHQTFTSSRPGARTGVSETRDRVHRRGRDRVAASLKQDDAPVAKREVVFDIDDLERRLRLEPRSHGVTLDIYKNLITAVIGPSGCGKSTFIRCLNRMNDLVPGVKVGGQILYHGEDLYGSEADPVEVRRRIGMVFQKPNPFPKSIYDNVAFAPKVLGMKEDLDERVERALRGAALWDEVKDRLKRSALALSGGQQQRLCIARALAVEPEVILLDEPASALDPISTAAIEDLMHELKRDYTLVIVTHNMQQAARVADMTAFFSLEVDGRRPRTGSSSSTTRRRRSSRTRPTSGPRTTSPAASDERRASTRSSIGLEQRAPGGERPRAAVAAGGARTRSSTATRSSPTR